MPKHLVGIETVGALPDPTTLEPGYPVVHGGLLKKVNAAQDGFDTLAGPGVGRVAAVTAAYTVDSGTTVDHIILANATTAAFDVTLPAATTGRMVTIKKTDAANPVGVVTPGAETIDGAASDSLAGQYDAMRLVSDGTNWFKV